MKTLKIILAIAVVAALGYFVWQWLNPPPPPPPPPPPTTNVYVQRVEKEIDSLKTKSVQTFCKDFYTNIQYRIQDYYNDGLLGNGKTTDNDQWKDILSERLYSVYTDKFIAQAFHVFNGSNWESSKLDFIDEETNLLQKSVYLKAGSDTGRFTEIHTILNKYREISRFIQDAHNYINNGYFDLARSKSYLSSAKRYITNNLDNVYVNNNTRLRGDLQALPGKAYTKHLNNLNTRMNQNRNRYRTVTFTGSTWAEKTSQYRERFWEPVNDQITELENEEHIYSVSSFQANIRSLKNRWNTELNDAIAYFRNQSN